MVGMKALLVIVATVSGFKLWAATLFPITCDEAYYWLWQQHLALSYVDHPPLIAWFNKFVGLFGEYDLFHYRLAGLIVALIATYFIYATGKTLFDRKIGTLAAIFFQLVPHYIIVWLTVTIDNLLALWWIIALYCLARISKMGRGRDWLWLGLAFGLGLLSKYTMAFFLLPLLCWLLLPENRPWFRRAEPWLGLGLSVIVFLPVLIWNYQHHWLSFTFHTSRLGRTDFVNNFLSLLADQLVHFTPFLLLGLLIYSRPLWQKSRLLWLFALVPLAVFTGFTALIRVWAHWVIVYQFAALIGVALLAAHREQVARRMVISLVVFALLAVTLILAGSATILPRQDAYRQNYKLAAAFASVPLTTPIITPFLGSSSQLTFYARRQTYMADGVLKLEENGFGKRQYMMWGYPDLKPGDDVIYYGPDDQPTRVLLQKYFRRVEVAPRLKLAVIESYLDVLVPYDCRGLKGAVRL
ncbi:MAG: glycosyltransferase family 39 protein [Candidatus Margulisbacteria bacterium]|nr:glycosyltransferase family 39 protein [Candidatus Margulisiibacteriota bacterium]